MKEGITSSLSLGKPPALKTPPFFSAPLPLTPAHRLPSSRADKAWRAQVEKRLEWILSKEGKRDEQTEGLKVAHTIA